MHRFKELIAWQKGRSLVKDIYKSTIHFPKEEIYGLTSQIRRTSVSIPTNLAEGAGRRTNAQFLTFLDYAYGSSIEVENLLILSHDLGFIDSENYKNLESKCLEVQKLVYSLISKFSK